MPFWQVKTDVFAAVFKKIVKNRKKYARKCGQSSAKGAKVRAIYSEMTMIYSFLPQSPQDTKGRRRNIDMIYKINKMGLRFIFC